MPVGRLATATIKPVFDALAAQAAGAGLWLGVVTADPFAATDPDSVELIGGTYVRVRGDWTRSGDNALLLSSDATFRGLPLGAHVAGVGVWTASAAGLFKAGALLAAPVDFPTGGAWTLPAGELLLGIDVVTI